MSDDRFERLLGWFMADREALELELWAAQLREWPDSRRVTVVEAYDWLHPKNDPDLTEAGAWWDKQYPPSDFAAADSMLRRVMRDKYLSERLAEHRLRVARGLALGLQYPVFVIYECGLKADGTYRWRGFRYGTKGSEYQSGFGRD